MTKKGWASGRVTPSVVTWPSASASNKLDWVRGVARLISSTSTTDWILARSRASNSAEVAAGSALGRTAAGSGAVTVMGAILARPVTSLPHGALQCSSLMYSEKTCADLRSGGYPPDRRSAHV